jgi:hypothetical protein
MSNTCINRQLSQVPHTVGETLYHIVTTSASHSTRSSSHLWSPYWLGGQGSQ